MYKKETLKNGLRLITAPLSETKTANIFALFRVGSRYESKKMNGASHFVEHMMFKGTKNRPNGLAVSKDLDGVGAEHNAFTSKDNTGYYIKADSKHLSLATDIISDMILHSKFESQEVEREKGVIVEEINMYEDNPIYYVDSLMEQLMFGSNSLSMMVGGSRETVKGISRDDLYKYYRQMYTANNAVICVAGNFNSSNIAEVKKTFSLLPKGPKHKFVKFNSDQKKPRIKVNFKETEQAQMCLGFPGYSYGDKNNIALQVLSVILGGNMSSRLFLSVREREGLAYYIHASVNNFEDTGAMYVQAGLDKSRIYDAIKLIKSELKNVAKTIKADEIKRAKDYIAGRIAIDLEDTSSLSQWYAFQELMINKIATPDERMKAISEVTADDLSRVAKDILNFKRMNIAVIGPYRDDKKFKELL
ncbi:MAG: pitrilysin family protein [Candidatus Buchananbacteria bacterium]